MRLYLSLILIVLTLSISAQELRKPEKSDFGIGLNLNGAISNIGLSSFNDPFGQNLVFGRYYISELTALRFGLGFSGGQINTLSTDSIGAALRNFDSTYTQLNASLGIGIEKHFKTSSRIDPYIGADVNVGRIGKIRIKSESSLQDTSGISTIQVDEEYSGGVQFALSGIVGMNYFVAKKFALGAEYNLSYAYSSQGGDYNIITINTPISGTASTTRLTGSTVSRAHNIMISGVLSLRISYFFGGKSKSDA